MQILINGKIATLKKGSSFEFVSENRSFTDSDGYSFSISFPLAGCPGNLAIFGHLNRTDIDNSQIIFDCEVIDTYFYKAGIITITEITTSEIKAQFLEGRSASNFDVTFDDIYINELDLGEPVTLTPPSDPNTAWQGLNFGQEYVALPWVNNASGNIQNDVVYNGGYKWADDVSKLSFFPYLIVITKKICETLGYDCDLSEWENLEEKKYIIICNALPAAWDIPQFARSLPHWSVTEYLEKLEHFLGCEFDINHKIKKISLAFINEVLSSAQPIFIDKVLNSFTAEVSAEDESNYIENVTVRYKECGHNMQKFYACRWFVKEQANSVVPYDTLDELISANKIHARCRNYSRGSNVNKVLYARDFDMYFVIRCIRNELAYTNSFGINIYDRICILQPINVFGEKVHDEASANEIELEFVPACIDETEESKGNCLFLDMAGYDETSTSVDDNTDRTPMTNEERAATIYQPVAMNLLSKGDEKDQTEYFNQIYVAFWDGINNHSGKLPCPTLDWVTIKGDWTYYTSKHSLRLTHSSMSPIFAIDPTQKYTFSFLMNEMPDVRSIFFIDGKKYLCEKITTTFTENGMSQLKKGVFYRLLDE